jgi:hypothetical protein
MTQKPSLWERPGGRHAGDYPGNNPRKTLQSFGPRPHPGKKNYHRKTPAERARDDALYRERYPEEDESSPGCCVMM